VSTIFTEAKCLSGDGRLIDAFTEIVERFPDRPAVIHNGRAMTYAQLDAEVRRAARNLGAPPRRGGGATSRTPDTIASLFAIWAAGGAYCPIDPAFPEERQKAMREAAGCDEASNSDDIAYILFTSGSTGEPKRF
jgi:nonribosomal peptide synthetase protein VioO